MTPSQALIYVFLKRHAREWVSQEAIVDLLYRDREDGGPTDTKSIVRAFICGLRKKLPASERIINWCRTGCYKWEPVN